MVAVYYSDSMIEFLKKLEVARGATCLDQHLKPRSTKKGEIGPNANFCEDQCDTP